MDMNMDMEVENHQENTPKTPLRDANFAFVDSRKVKFVNRRQRIFRYLTEYKNERNVRMVHRSLLST